MDGKVTLDSMPEFLTIVDISNIIRLDVAEARRFVRRNREMLKPFKAGREVRCQASNFKKLLDTLQQAAN